MNSVFFDNLLQALAAERLDAYRHDQAEPHIALARYLWNMALCESLYSPLQMVEVGLRNALQRALEKHFRTAHWYDQPACQQLLTRTQQSQVSKAKENLQRLKKTISPGRMVAELTFGFWTAFFNKRFAQSSEAVHIAVEEIPTRHPHTESPTNPVARASQPRLSPRAHHSLERSRRAARLHPRGD